MTLKLLQFFKELRKIILWKLFLVMETAFFTAYGDFSRSREYRNIVCQTIFNNWQNWHEAVELFHGPLMTRYKYWGSMIKLNGWAKSSEIEAAAHIFKKCQIN